MSTHTDCLDCLTIDGGYGEGGGQIVRGALTLACLTGRPVHIGRIRAQRRKPGLAAQHLTSVRAAAELCAAEVTGAELGSQALTFRPQRMMQPGSYRFDVAAARLGGSAGATMLVLQTVLLPLACAEGESTVVLEGGTHVPMSPPFDYVRDVWLPTLARLGIAAHVWLERPGWYPAGGGKVCAAIRGSGKRARFSPLWLTERGNLKIVRGCGLASALPSHVAERMAGRAREILQAHGILHDIRAVTRDSDCPGAGLFLVAEYQHAIAGFSALGERGKPAESVAEEACAALFFFHESEGAVEAHLADQLIIPTAVCEGESAFTVQRVTLHLETVAWLVERFGVARVRIERDGQRAACVRVKGNLQE